MLTSEDIKAQASKIGFDVCGIAPVAAFSELRFLSEWIKRGDAGEMHYMVRSAARRADVRNVMPSAQSVVCLGTVYNVDRPYSTERPNQDEALVSRYAWGADYHTVLGERTEALLAWMRDANQEVFEARAYVDTGPVQERVYAQYAGIGWIGKNTCLINPQIGSWLFLSEIICSLALEPDEPALDHCGTCTLCLEACPTDALAEPWVVDSRECLSYLTIELRGPIPEEQRKAVGTHVYGCDICQDVCPYNAAPACSTDPAWQPAPEFDSPRLADLWRQPDATLERLLERSAMSRAGLRGLRRNLAVGLGNSGTTASDAALSDTDSPEDQTRRDPLVAEHVEWARKRTQRC